MKKKKVAKNKFSVFLDTIAPGDAVHVRTFFEGVRQHTALPEYENKQIRTDFENAIMYLTNAGTPMDKILERLSPSNMGGFYTRPSTLWFKLDDAAKIYPVSMQHGKMAVFRLSVYLKELVVPEILQMALTFTIKRFPSFATSVKKGFFWHYLNASKRRYAINPETDAPCRPIRIQNSGSPAFQIVYHNNRISIDFFHILTDGSGGMVFLKTLVAEYLRLLGITTKEKDEQILDINAAPKKEEIENSYPTVAKTEKSSGFMGKPVLQMGGNHSRFRPCQILHFKMDAKALKDISKAKGGTVTAYMLSKMFLAGQVATEKLDGTYNIQLPVNMRKFYPRKTLLNFTMYCGIKMDIGDIKDDDELVKNIGEQIKTNATKEMMDEMANSAHKMASRLGPIPLFIKSPIAKIFYHFLADAMFSTTLSSLGVVTMPPELAAHIDSMDFILGPTLHRASCALLTMGNVATFSICKTTTDPTFEERMCEMLRADGLVVRVERSPLYGN